MLIVMLKSCHSSDIISLMYYFPKNGEFLLFEPFYKQYSFVNQPTQGLLLRELFRELFKTSSILDDSPKRYRDRNLITHSYLDSVIFFTI